MTRTVIIAVNDPHILYLLQRYAEESGFQTVSASWGKDVLALLAQQADPAFIILDAELPGASGQKMWHGVRAEAAARRVPIVVYSYQDELGAEWHEGVAACLPKSVMYDDFAAVLERAGVSLESVFP